MSTISERIKSARLMCEYSQRDLAEKAGVSFQVISKYERGEDIPSSTVLIKLSKALNISVNYLLRPITVDLTKPCFRKKKSLGLKAESAIFERTREWIERCLTVESLAGAELAPANLELISVHNYNEIERAAEMVRQRLQLGLDPIQNLTEVLEDAGIKVGLIDFNSDKVDALTLEANGNKVIVVKDKIPGDRQRLNIAHELAHIVLNVSKEIDEEKAAFRFAAAFLMPEEIAKKELKKCASIAELHLLKHKYGLSMQALIYRAKDLDIISEYQATELFKKFKKEGYHIIEPGDSLPSEKPQRMERLVVRILNENIISIKRATELLGESLETLMKEHGGIFPEAN